MHTRATRPRPDHYHPRRAYHQIGTVEGEVQKREWLERRQAKRSLGGRPRHRESKGSQLCGTSAGSQVYAASDWASAPPHGSPRVGRRPPPGRPGEGITTPPAIDDPGRLPALYPREGKCAPRCTPEKPIYAGKSHRLRYRKRQFRGPFTTDRAPGRSQRRKDLAFYQDALFRYDQPMTEAFWVRHIMSDIRVFVTIPEPGMRPSDVGLGDARSSK